jgi:hypothetical protein
MNDKHQVSPENAAKFWDWIQNRGGVAIWRSVNLSNPGASWSTPARTIDNQLTPRPTWQAENHPSRVITDAADIEVSIDKEVKRFHVAIRRGSQGLSFKCTDASSRRIEREVAKAGEGAYHTFDYLTQEAVIMKPEKTVPLIEWLQSASGRANE